MVFSCSPSPHTTSVDPLGINFDIMNKISVSPLGSHENDNMANVLNSHSPNLEMSIGEVTVASAVASEKARVRQQSAMLDKWLMANGGNLYPCREDKEKLAAQMKMTYLQVNRWFANRRRKQTKRSKVVPSPASVTPATVNQESTSRPNTPVSKENVMTQLTPDVISAFAQALAAQQPEVDEKMVLQQQPHQLHHHQPQREHAITPPAIDDHHMHGMNPTSTTQVVPDMRSNLVSPLNAHEMAAKMLANGSLSPNTNGLAQYNPFLLAVLQPFAIQQLLQAQALQQQYMQLQQQAVAQQQLEAQALWASSSISASPAHASDSEVSEMSELSPLPQTEVTMRPHSPPFKDPHQLADKSLLRLLNLNQLSEKEQMAVAVLAGFASMGR
ncbi:hypothetical protein Q1695_009649 [Nippostrongylus brasiliensis]|nr:hypothetical protein Q1695_009649 [Nippostrongylus brasiliensis]